MEIWWVKSPSSPSAKTLAEIMKTSTSTIIFFVLIALFSCQSERNFPEVKNLSYYKNTEFVPTLEHEITQDKNAVYCVTLLFAWDGVKKILNSPLIISDEYLDLKIVNESNSYKNVLLGNEYQVEYEVTPPMINVKAEFTKSLSFNPKFNSYKGKLSFGGQNVQSFGVSGMDSDKLLKAVEVVYYKDDNNFIVKLFPTQKDHEIILFMTDKKFSSLIDMTQEVLNLTSSCGHENSSESDNYIINRDDIVIIPKFNFNIETNYSRIEGNQFSASNRIYTISKAWQRTAFILDESGAEIESEAEISIESSIQNSGDIMTKPKKMIFSKPFFILLKRKDSTNPYFGMWVANTELMLNE